MNCPNCNRDVSGNKYAIFECRCGKTLMIIEINKVKQVMDVTKNEEVTDERN